MEILVYPCIAYKTQHEDKPTHTTLHRPVLFCSYIYYLKEHILEWYRHFKFKHAHEY